MIKHFGIYANSGDVQTALNEETLVNPYVAKVSGALDYNSIQPVGPCYLGEWSDDGEGHYTFQILDAEATAWDNEVNIGTLLDVYYNGNQTNMYVILQFDGYNWNMSFVPVGGDPSDGETYSFTEDNPDTWTTSNTMTDPGSSASPITVVWDGEDTFVLEATPDYPLSINTINPECE